MIRAISGIGETTGLSTSKAAIGWSIVIGTTLFIVIGTLMLKPGKGH